MRLKPTRMLLISLLAVVAAVLIWDLRIVVIEPMSSLPAGATAIMSGLDEARLIDSAEEICERQRLDTDALCEDAGLAIEKSGKIVLLLPFSRWLDDLTEREG